MPQNALNIRSDSLFILQLLLILLVVRLVAYGRQDLRLGVVIVEAHIELLVELVHQVLHRLEAHHLREVLQLGEVFAGDGGHWDGGGGGGVRGVFEWVVQLVHAAGPEVLKLLIQTHERGFHGVPVC